ncbi:MAG: hypothetical protein H0W09_07185, partial [Solirubrobacterales bacterium]|nr:hypothetical protein [Solirubrobacterales bacterium]
KVGTLPGAPPDGGPIDTAKLRVTRVDRRVGGQRRHYVTTPRGCPQRGTWTTLLRFGYGEGQRQTERTRTRCEA